MADMHCSGCGALFDAKPNRIKHIGKRCPECVRAREKAWRLRRKEEGRPVISTKMPRDYHREYEKKYFNSGTNRERRNRLAKAYREDPRLRARHEARWLVHRAIASGKLLRMPCEGCSSSPAQAHHDDYNKPLEIRWLCTRCHSDWHATNTPIYPSARGA